MNRRLFVQSSALATASVLLPNALVLAAGSEGKVGKMDAAEFMKINKEAGAKVAAIKPSAEPLSKADEKLMMEIAMGGMMQLEVSKEALKMAKNPEVRTLAEAEVEEQTGLAAKLKEVAAAKKVTLPEKADEKTTKELAKLHGLSGAEFDKAYLQDSGIGGHKLLKATMEKVESKAADATLKTLATTTLPLIKTHLQVAEEEAAAKA